ncbi:hypothetical protein ACJ73_00574 [Blastomyces percursus]|uniref:Isopropylmalate dehydrogenase-like domain-containing protein n=1 Tax=Blastomyces percursus TaxID=1658174 RepID=A0A1J9R6M4_9EURO|nr:hypothetical protein ACJ73_00574 [Blastomyces percursus]
MAPRGFVRGIFRAPRGVNPKQLALVNFIFYLPLVVVYEHSRRTRSYLPLGSPTSNMPTITTIRKRPTNQGLSRRPIAAPRLQTRRSRRLIVRESSEGEYAGHRGRSHVGKPWELATDISIFTRHGVEQIMKFAFETARSRAKKHIIVVTKSNTQRNGLVIWDEVAADVAAQFPDVTCDRMLVDAMTARMVLKPESLDTIVATNLHADILSDLAAALEGSMGIAPTSNIDPTSENPSMFEPIHGSAFDIAGKDLGIPIFGYSLR